MNNFPTPPHSKLLPSTWRLAGPAANGGTNVAPCDVIYQYELGDAWWWLGALVHILPALIALGLGLAFAAPVIAVAAVPLAAVGYLIGIRPTLTRLVLTSDTVTCQSKFHAAITMPYANVVSTSRQPVCLTIRTKHGTFKLRSSFIGRASEVASIIALYRAMPVAPLAFRAHPSRQPARVLVAPAYSRQGLQAGDGVLVRHGDVVAFVQNDRCHVLAEAAREYVFGPMIGQRKLPLERWLADAAQTGDMMFTRSLAKLVDHCGGFIVSRDALTMTTHAALLSNKQRLKFTYRGTQIETHPVHSARAEALTERAVPAVRNRMPSPLSASISPWETPTLVTPAPQRFGR